MKPGDLVISKMIGKDNILGIYLGEFTDAVFGRQAKLLMCTGEIYLCHHDWLVRV
jgi:hypothetical protein